MKNSNNQLQSLLIILLFTGIILIITDGYFLLFLEGISDSIVFSQEAYDRYERFVSTAWYGTPIIYFLLLVNHYSNPRHKGKKRTWSRPGTHQVVVAFCVSVGAFMCMPFDTRSGYMMSLCFSLAGFLALALGLRTLARTLMGTGEFGIKTPTRKKRSRYGFNLRLNTGWINITNPFRGTLLTGGPGSGKTYSVVEEVIAQAVKKDYCGLVYDFKFPTLTEHVFTQMSMQKNPCNFQVINFTDLSRTSQVNPLDPELMTHIAHARQRAMTVMSNLIGKKEGGKYNFWLESAITILSGVFWYLKLRHPNQCTLPHAIALICRHDFEKILPKMAQDSEVAGMFASIQVALEKKAGEQIAGMLSTLQNSLAQLNTPEIAWVLSGNDFSLDLNNPDAPTLLCVGSEPSLSYTLAPVISLITSVAIQQMNQPNKHHSLVLLDEAPTLYIPGFAQIPATARSHKLATFYVAQDISQMEITYGKAGAEALLGTLQNHLYGKASNLKTADHVSSMFDRTEKEVSSEQFGDNHDSISFQERETRLLPKRDVIDLSLGEFVGVVSGKHNEWFKGKVMRPLVFPSDPLPSFAKGVDQRKNFERIHQEVKNLFSIS